MIYKDQTVTLALWAANYGHSFSTLDEWHGCAEQQIEKAAAAQVSLLLWPEWLSDQWFGFAPRGLDLSLSPWSGQMAENIFSALGKKANDLGMAVVAGTAPSPADQQGKYFNRARIYLPDKTIHQDKLTLTPPELKLPNCTNGQSLNVFTWQGWRIAIVICLDCEWPHLSAELLEADIDLILIPSQTSAISGYHRVNKSAQTRAIELFCPVAVVGGIGTTPTPDVKPRQTVALTNVGGAAVYLPCEKSLGIGEGIASQTGPIAEIADADGLLHIVRDVPTGYCRRIRREGGAEAWSRQQMGRSVIVQIV